MNRKGLSIIRLVVLIESFTKLNVLLVRWAGGGSKQTKPDGTQWIARIVTMYIYNSEEGIFDSTNEI